MVSVRPKAVCPVEDEDHGLRNVADYLVSVTFQPETAYSHFGYSSMILSHTTKSLVLIHNFILTLFSLQLILIFKSFASPYYAPPNSRH